MVEGKSLHSLCTLCASTLSARNTMAQQTEHSRSRHAQASVTRRDDPEDGNDVEEILPLVTYTAPVHRMKPVSRVQLLSKENNNTSRIGKNWKTIMRTKAISSDL